MQKKINFGIVHSFNPQLAAVIGLEEAILLQHIAHWCRENFVARRNIRDGRAWTYNSIAAYTELFPYMTTAKIRRALDNLVVRGLVRKGNYGNSRTSWYSLTSEGEEVFGVVVSDGDLPLDEETQLEKTEKKSDADEVEEKYMSNFQELSDSGKIAIDKPIVNWAVARWLEKSVVKKLGKEKVFVALERAMSDKFCLESGYSLSTILSAGVLSRLLNGSNSKSNITADRNFDVDEFINEMRNRK